MKKVIVLSFLLTAIFTNLSAHNIWLETSPDGERGKAHKVHVYYGEYSYDYYEKVSGNFREVANFQLWVVDPDGEKTALETTAGELKYTAEFTPEKPGVYTILLSSTKTEVVDWTEYDLGVLKPDFYASASIAVDRRSQPVTAPQDLTESNALVIHDDEYKTYTTGADANVTVFFKGEPVAEQELVISIADQWSKTIYTDEHGIAEFTLPWEGQYILEAVFTEEVAGAFMGKDYEAMRHTATYTIKTK